MAPEMTVQYVAPSKLRPHPAQERIYGAVGGDHDPGFDAFAEGIGVRGIREPIVVSHGTPGVEDWTVISGHRRTAAALRVGLESVPVVLQQYASELDAREAHVVSNDQRAKDEWIKTQEAAAMRVIESERAQVRMLAGKAGPSDNISPGSVGRTREKIATHLGESPQSTAVRLKLADKAREQNPEHPEASPIALDLKANKGVHTVAKKHGVVAAPKPAPKAEKPSAEKRPTLDAVLYQINVAGSQRELEAAYGQLQKLKLRPADGDAAAEVYRRRSAEITKPAGAVASPLQERQAAQVIVQACAAFRQRVGETLAALPLHAMRDAESRETVAASLAAVVATVQQLTAAPAAESAA